MFRFLYFSGLVRRNSFVNVVFAVGDMAKVRCKVPKWLRFRGFARWVAAVGSRSVGFIGCGIGFCCHVRAVSGWERGLLCGETGVCVIGLFRFRVVKRKRTPCDVPKNKMKKSNTGSTNLFLLFRFRRLRGAKVVFFLFVSAKTVFVFRVFNRCFQCFQCSLRGFRGSNAAFADFEAVVDVFFLVVQHGGEACGVPDCGVEGWEMGVSVVGFEELGDVKGVAVRQDLLIECGSADAVEGFAV